jgi:serine/threonine-protein kinase
VKRFRLEARLAASLNHRNVITVYDFDQADDGSLFIAMEYLEGRTLAEVVRKDGALAVGRAVRLSLQIAQGLEAAHRAGVIHRDIKPHNIMVLGAGDEIKLMDFGIARMMDAGGAGLTRTGVVMGTPAYMAPEQIEGGDITEQTDIYAFGTVLYEMLAGSVPFAAATPRAVLAKHLREPPRPLRAVDPKIPVAVERVVMQALEKDPQARPGSMGAVIAGLSATASHGAPSAFVETGVVGETAAELRRSGARTEVGVSQTVAASSPTVPAGQPVAASTGRAAAATVPAGTTVASSTVAAASPTVAAAPRREGGPWKFVALAAAAVLVLVMAGGGLYFGGLLGGAKRSHTTVAMPPSQPSPSPAPAEPAGQDAERERRAQLQAEEEKRRAEVAKRQADEERKLKAAEDARIARQQAEDEKRRKADAEAQQRQREVVAQGQRELEAKQRELEAKQRDLEAKLAQQELAAKRPPQPQEVAVTPQGLEAKRPPPEVARIVPGPDEIRKQVEQKLRASGFNLQVKIDPERIVTLTGGLESREMVEEARRIASSVGGVKEVKDFIILAPPGTTRRVR